MKQFKSRELISLFDDERLGDDATMTFFRRVIDSLEEKSWFECRLYESSLIASMPENIEVIDENTIKFNGEIRKIFSTGTFCGDGKLWYNIMKTDRFSLHKNQLFIPDRTFWYTLENNETS